METSTLQALAVLVLTMFAAPVALLMLARVGLSFYLARAERAREAAREGRALHPFACVVPPGGRVASFNPGRIGSPPPASLSGDWR